MAWSKTAREQRPVRGNTKHKAKRNITFVGIAYP